MRALPRPDGMVTSVFVILSFALVLVAVVLLVLGLLTSDGLGLIYASMACSLLAGIVLYVAIRMGRPEMQEASAGAPAPAAARPAPISAADAGERATAATAPQREATGTVAVLERDEPSGGRDETELLEPEEFDDEEEDEELVDDEELDEDFFPIADYDELNVSEIMPLLPELYPEELDEVEAHERSTKSRVTILTRIQELREELRHREAGEEWDVPDEGWRDEGEAEVEPAGVPASFPIAGYDTMTAPEITRRLADLDPDGLLQVRAREQSVDARVTVLREIDRLLDEAGEATEPAAAAPRRAAKRAAPRKTAAKRSAARKTATRKKAAGTRAPAKRAATKKAAKRAATKKAPTKRAATKRAAPKKSAAKRSATKKSAAKKTAKRTTKRARGR